MRHISLPSRLRTKLSRRLAGATAALVAVAAVGVAASASLYTALSADRGLHAPFTSPEICPVITTPNCA